MPLPTHVVRNLYIHSLSLPTTHTSESSQAADIGLSSASTMPSPIFTAPARGSYELVRSEDSDDSNAATLAADHDLPLTSEELDFDDPLDEKSDSRFGFNLTASSPVSRLSNSWPTFTQRLRWWRPSFTATNPPPADYAVEEGREDAGLLQTNCSSNVQPQSAVIAWLIWPLPSWSHRFFGHPAPEEPHRSTDYLDGLRGVASLFVFFDHYLLAGMADIVNYSYGADENWNVLQLPFLRTVFSGGAMVSIFFVISGYVLSARCIVAARAGKPEKAFAAINSMTFRRAMRLFLPSIAVSFLAVVATCIGFRQTNWPQNWTPMGELGHYGEYLNRELFRVWNWDEELYRLGSPEWNGWYAGQLWTIPREFNCSMLLFLLLIATVRCTAPMRFTIEASLMAYLLWEGRWDVATFIAGMATAEVNVTLEERRQAKKEAFLELTAGADRKVTAPRAKRRWSSFLRQSPFWAALIFGWYLTGIPYLDHERTPGYAFLTEYWKNDPTYKYRFWLAIGGILVTSSLTFLPTAQRFFTTSVARYLGKISYALYLIHAFMNATIRWEVWTLFGVLTDPSKHKRHIPFSWSWFFATIVYVQFTLWAADVFWRLVDAPSVKFAKWVEKKCFIKNEKN